MENHIIKFPKNETIKHEAFYALCRGYDSWGIKELEKEEPVRFSAIEKIRNAKKSVTLTHEEWVETSIWVGEAVSIRSDNVDPFPTSEFDWTQKDQDELMAFWQKYF